MDRRYRVREGLGLTLVLIAVFAFLSFASYHPADSADVVFPANSPPANAGGWVGATISYALFYFFGGVASFALVFLLAAWGLTACVVRERTGNVWLRLTGGVLFLSALAATDALIGLAPLAGLPTGGALGVVAGPFFLAGNFGATGAYLIVAWAALLSMLLATDFLFYRAARELWGRTHGWAHAAKAAVAASDAAKRAAFAAGDMAANAAGAAGAAVEGMLAAVPRLDADAEIDAELAAAEESQILPVRSRLDSRRGKERVARDPKASGRASRRGSGRVERDGSGRLVGTPQPTSMTEQGPFLLPAPSLLAKPETTDPRANTTLVKEKCRDITKALAEFNVDAKVVGVEVGPVITQYELELGRGVKISAVSRLSANLAMRLKSPKVRVVAPIPGRSTIGIELPNVYPATVRLSELLAAGDVARRKLQLPIFLGKDVAGRPLVEDLAEMPHLLVAGASGSGKSNCLQTLLASLCFTRSPEDVRFVLVDPKMVELTAYRDIPHLLAPPVTDTKKAAETLQWLAAHMDWRYERFAQAGVRNLRSYNDLSREELADALGDDAVPADLAPMPQIVLIIDEVSDLILMARAEVETAIARLSQKARAVGIHMVLATQRPSADVLTGIIKANLNCRIAFQVSSKINSMVILDEQGAEELIGRGDLLYKSPRGQALVRAQCTYVDDAEIKRMCDHLRAQGAPSYDPALTDGTAAPMITASTGKGSDDDLFEAAVECVFDTNRASATLLQRRFSIGYSRASRLLDAMEEAGVVGPHRGGKARKILVTAEAWESRRTTAA